jgi:hypothetical protein
MTKKIAFIVAALFAFGISAQAFALPPKGSVAAYVWSGDAGAMNQPAAAYSFNAANKANQVKKTAAGKYEVTLQGVGTSGGHAIAQSYGPAVGYCKVVQWTQKSADLSVQVACFNATGAPTDTAFTLMFVM